MHLHIDGDIIVYRAGFAAERTKRRLRGCFPKFDEQVDITFDYAADLKKWLEHQPDFEQEGDVEVFTVLEPVENALANVDSMIRRMVKQTGAREYTVYLSGGSNFRDDIATLKKYKGNRDKAHKPTHEHAIRDHIEAKHPTVWSDFEEADDVIGYTHYAMYVQDPESTCIATLDKDLDMIPGLHYNFAKEVSYEVYDGEADQNFWMQMITGDATDNIPGLKGKGKAFAANLMQECGGYEDVYKDEIAMLYKLQFGDDWLTYMNEMGRLLWIRRQPDELWEYSYEQH